MLTRKRNRIVTVISLVGMICSGGLSCAEARLAYLDPNLPIEKRLDDLIARTSIQQKIRALKDFNQPINEGDVQIPAFPRGEALHGMSFPKTNNTTVWPTPIVLGSTWDDKLIYDMAGMISDEARAQYHHGPDGMYGRGPLIVYAPGIYLARDPRWGRYQECYGEDPFLVSRCVVSYVKGMQGDHPKYLKTACTTKNIAAYNKEHYRFGHNAKISERWLREYYFKIHKAAFQEANCRATMTAYNALNGIPCSANKWLLTDVLRNEWGFDGFVMEDASATMAIAKEDAHRGLGCHGYVDTYVEAAAAALNAGTDLMLSMAWIEDGRLEKAIQQGLTTEAKLNQAFRRVMRVVMQCGIFDPPELSPWYHLPFETLCSPKHTAHARMAAQKGIILLQNRPTKAGKKVLPIDKKKVKSIAVIGPNAQAGTLGIYSGRPKFPTSVLDGIKQVAGKDIAVQYVPWVRARTEELLSGRSSATVGLDGVPGWKIEYFDNLEFEGAPVFTDVVDFVSVTPETKLPEEIAGKKHYSIRWTSEDINPPQTGRYRFNAFSTDYITFSIDGKTIIEEKKPHWRIERRAEYDLRSDRSYDMVVEFKRLSEQERRVTHTQLYWEKPSSASSVQYGEVEAAKRCDLVVAVLGLHPRDEGEGGADRTFPNIEQDQIEMLRKIAKVNPNIVTVLINGSPLTLTAVTDLSPAILEAWYPGQAGIAVADLLFGHANPSGHLPCTIYKSWDQIKSIDDYEIDRGRTYMYVKGEVSFPFGHGLSYTEFEFSNLKLDKDQVAKDGEVTVTVTVQNTGELTGSDVVQIYARQAERVEGRPKRRLVGFKRVDDLKPGEKKTAAIVVKIKDLEYWDAEKRQMCVIPGDYVLEVGQNSQKIVATAKLLVIE